ncbi:MAG TPA: Gfo/Idh/MocA family oxidoreductase [Solirubrobacteraceae bacterium]|jgi:predicted dehydrogenase|nr:Gfo/Idh/MocA family oxidoreductase [Solirubrobacteraceae bacterium]
MSGLSVAIVGCGLIGDKRASALASEDRLVGCFDVDDEVARRFSERHATPACASLEELLSLAADVVVVAVVHDQLAGVADAAMQAGAHVLVEKPAGVSAAQIEGLIERREQTRRLVKVGFNHRFHPGIARAAAEVRSGRHGELMHLRGRYGHGGRLGYDREWRADPERSGGGELIDQGMHLLDLTHMLAGPLPLHSAMLRTHFWDTPVEDNAALILGAAQSRTEPWALLHVSWTEWKNLFSLEIYCRTAKIQVDGLVRSYGPQRLRIYEMSPELGPPRLEEIQYPDEDGSWLREWAGFKDAIDAGDLALVDGGLEDALYAWRQIEAAYADTPYSAMRATLDARALS